jgi:hypothetical protein
MASSLEIVPWSCHICHSAFSETHGGLCRSCGQATCGLCWGDRASFLPSRQTQRQCRFCIVRFNHESGRPEKD